MGFRATMHSRNPARGPCPHFMQFEQNEVGDLRTAHLSAGISYPFFMDLCTVCPLYVIIILCVIIPFIITRLVFMIFSADLIIQFVSISLATLNYSIVSFRFFSELLLLLQGREGREIGGGGEARKRRREEEGEKRGRKEWRRKKGKEKGREERERNGKKGGRKRESREGR